MKKAEKYLKENYPPEAIEDIEFSNSIKQAYLDGMLEGLKTKATKYIPAKIGSSTLHINAERINAFMTPDPKNIRTKGEIVGSISWIMVILSYSPRTIYLKDLIKKLIAS